MAVLIPDDIYESDRQVRFPRCEDVWWQKFCYSADVYTRRVKKDGSRGEWVLTEFVKFSPLYQCDSCGAIHSRKFVKWASFHNVDYDVRESESGWYCWPCYNKRMAHIRTIQQFHEIVKLNRRLEKAVKENRNGNHKHEAAPSVSGQSA